MFHFGRRANVLETDALNEFFRALAIRPDRSIMRSSAGWPPSPRGLPTCAWSSARTPRATVMSELDIRRVVVACDATSASADALALAAQLAARWQVTLHGLFVEDVGLLALAELPFARELHFGAGAASGLERTAIEGQLAAFAARARQHLAAAAERRGVDWSFQIVRASIPGATLPFEPTDFLVLEGLSRPFATALRIASPWPKVALAATQPLFLLRNNRRLPGSILALVDEAAATAASILGMASWLAETEGRRLTIAGIGDAGDRERIGPPRLALSDMRALHRRLEQSDCRVLVMSREVQDRTLIGTAKQDILLV